MRSGVRGRHPRPLFACILIGLAVATAARGGSPPPAEDRARTPLDSLAIAEINGLMNSSRWAEAESLIVAARARIDAATPVDSLLWAQAADLLVGTRVGGGRSQDPTLRPLAERALDIRERFLPPDHLDIARSLIRLAHLLNTQGDCAAALPHVQRGVAIRVRNYGEDHIMVARGVTIEGMVLSDCGDYAAARAAFARTLAIREKVLGPDHAEIAVSLTNIASVDRNLGDFEAAVEALERALRIPALAATESSSLAFVIQNLADCHYALGQYGKAREECERALAMRERVLGPGHREIGSSWNNLGGVLIAMGDFAGARIAFEHAIEIYTAARGPEHPDVALALGSLGGLLYMLGDYGGARDRYARALAINRKALGDGNPSLAYSVMDLASATSMLGEHTRALELAGQAIALADSGWGTTSPLSASALDTYGSICEQLERHDEARASYERALAIREDRFGREHPEVARSLEVLAGVDVHLGEPERAWLRYQRAIAIREATQGADHPALAASLAGAAKLRLDSGARDEALAMALRAERIGRAHLSLTAQSLPEREALQYAGTRADALDVLLAIAARGSTHEETAEIWEATLASRALVLDEMAERLRVSRLRADPGTAALLDEYAESSAHLARLLTSAPPGADAARERERIAVATTRREQAERALAAGSVRYPERAALRAASFGDIVSALPSDAALVAFARYAENDRADAYLAFVTRHDGRPVAVPLGPAAAIDEAVARWRNELSTGALAVSKSPAEAERRSRVAGESVRRFVWDPLATEMGGAGVVFLVPEGPLHLVNLAALPVDDSRYLIDAGPLVHLLTSERDLLSGDAGREAGRGLLALGGASFDLRGTLAATGRAQDSSPALELAHSGNTAAFRGALSTCVAFHATRFMPLEASVREVERVAQLWQRSQARERTSGGAFENALWIKGAAASEESFKTLAPGHRVLHLATHGFFVGASCEAVDPGTRGIGAIAASNPPGVAPATSKHPVTTSVNPLRLSGLALAGANLRASAPPDSEDGILTAEEIAALDLEGVEWAVLSACDTGLGDVGAGEGVFGLRRALRIAGARTQILSLWSVRDADAMQWMGSLYTARLEEGLDTAHSVRRASRELLADRRAAGESTHPFYWAGFVASGDWR